MEKYDGPQIDLMESDGFVSPPDHYTGLYIVHSGLRLCGIAKIMLGFYREDISDVWTGCVTYLLGEGADLITSSKERTKAWAERKAQEQLYKGLEKRLAAAEKKLAE